MELKDTVDLMLSDDCLERFKAEYYQLKIRYDRVRSIIKRYYERTLDFELRCPIAMLEGQKKAMYAYLCYMEARAIAEDMDVAPSFIDHLIEYEGFDSKLLRILRSCGIETIEELQDKTIAELRAVKGIGGASIMTIRKVLKKNGLCLKGDEDYLNDSSISQEEN